MPATNTRQAPRREWRGSTTAEARVSGGWQAAGATYAAHQRPVAHTRSETITEASLNGSERRASRVRAAGPQRGSDRVSREAVCDTGR
jgi:hypothetical protein